MPGSDGKDESKDEKPAAPRRLQSLSARGGAAGPRGGRFMPNAVGRRSKEERESSAPAMKPQASPDQSRDKQPPQTRSKFDRKKKQLGTRAEAAGPLAAPTINAPGASRRAPTMSFGSSGDSVEPSNSRGGVGGGRTVKSERDIEAAQSHLIIGEDGRIDMASGGNGEAFFPLRVPTDALPVETIKEEDLHAQPEAPGEAKAKEETAQASHEHIQLKEGELYLVQLPAFGLRAGPPPDGAALSGTKPDEQLADKVKQEEGDVEMADAPFDPNETVDKTLPESQHGRLGTLRRHASGKMTLLIGDSVFDVAQGTQSVSVENLMLVNPRTKVAHSLGNVNSRMLVMPNLDSLHI